jgi:peptidase E
MSNLLLIGGGTHTNQLLKPALESQGTEQTRALIIPSAASTKNAYDRKVPATEDRFKQLGIATSVLHDYGETPSTQALDDKFGSASMLYIIGGNSPYFYDTVRNHGSDKRIKAAVYAGILLAGNSAGALASFQVAHINPAKQPGVEDWDFAFQPMLGIVNATATAHANQHDKRLHDTLNAQTRLENFSERFSETGLSLGFAIDVNAAIHVTPDTVAVVSAQDGSTVHVVQKNNEQLSITPAYEPGQLQELSSGIFSTESWKN